MKFYYDEGGEGQSTLVEKREHSGFFKILLDKIFPEGTVMMQGDSVIITSSDGTNYEGEIKSIYSDSKCNKVKLNLESRVEVTTCFEGTPKESDENRYSSIVDFPSIYGLRRVKYDLNRHTL